MAQLFHDRVGPGKDDDGAPEIEVERSVEDGHGFLQRTKSIEHDEEVSCSFDGFHAPVKRHVKRHVT